MAEKSSIYIKRFGIGRIVEHQANALVFTLLVITGLSQRFHELKVSHWVIRAVGGVDILRMVHRWCGVLFTLLIAVHIAVGVYGMAYQFGFLLAQVASAPFLAAWNPVRYSKLSTPSRSISSNLARLISGLFDSAMLPSSKIALRIRRRQSACVRPRRGWCGFTPCSSPACCSATS